MRTKLTAKRSNRRAGGFIALTLMVAVAACAGGVGKPEHAISKMTRAYGGPEKIALLQSYAGKGFIKDLSQEMATSNAYDIFVKGPLYKHKVYRAPVGTLTDIVILYSDGREGHEWTKAKGMRSAPLMELAFRQYRFPAVLEWVRGTKVAGELLPVGDVDRDVRIRYREGDLVATLSLDRKSWLLSAVELSSVSDTLFFYVERYGHYHDVDGIPFPGTFTASYKKVPYFDYVLPSVELGAELPDSLFAVTRADTAALTGAAKP